jgi:EAL domain-containing protein (putative c-di-GMP-specific phosphodiesterase class I)
MTDSIDDAILRHALKDVAGWHAAGIAMPNLSVNVSATRLADPTLIPRLREMNIPPGTVSFEVLESIFADKIDDGLRHTLDALDEMGIAIEVDDFGTGHASLLALLALRPNRLKIARELIDPAPTSTEHHAVLESIMQIAKALDTEVVAEGIETEEHAVLSEEIGVHILQGFHFCRPLPAIEAATRIIDITAAAKTVTVDERAA